MKGTTSERQQDNLCFNDTDFEGTRFWLIGAVHYAKLDCIERIEVKICLFKSTFAGFGSDISMERS